MVVQLCWTPLWNLFFGFALQEYLGPIRSLGEDAAEEIAFNSQTLLGKHEVHGVARAGILLSKACLPSAALHIYHNRMRRQTKNMKTNTTYIYIYIYTLFIWVYEYVCMCVYMCVCVSTIAETTANEYRWTGR